MMITQANWNGKIPPIISVVRGADENRPVIGMIARPADAMYSTISRIASCIDIEVCACMVYGLCGVSFVV